MLSFPSFPLLLLVLCLLVTQRCSAQDSGDLSKITWINSLATKAELDAYVADTDTHGMASEVLSLKTTSKRYREDKIEVVMGSNPDGLTLAACLDGMKATKATKKLFLVVPSMKIYTETVKLLTAEVTEGGWITLDLRAFKGPNGEDSEWTLEQVGKELSTWPANVHKSFSMTNKYEGTDGYTNEVLEALETGLKTLGEIKDFGFIVDVFHLIKTPNEQQTHLSKALANVKRHDFFLDTTKEADVDVYKFKEYLDSASIHIKESYLNVPDAFREQWNAVTSGPHPTDPIFTEETGDVDPDAHPTTNIDTVPTQYNGCGRVHYGLASIIIGAISIL